MRDLLKYLWYSFDNAFSNSMKQFVFYIICVMCTSVACRAQASCDSLYAAEDRFWKAFNDKGNAGLILFDVPPRVTFGKEKLINYTGNKDKTGTVMYRVVVDKDGSTSCLKFEHASNGLLVEEANQIVQTLRFAPALLRDKGIKSTMHVIVRFYEEKPGKHRR